MKIVDKRTLVLGIMVMIAALSHFGKTTSNTIEAEKIVLKNPKGKGKIELGFNDTPYLTFLNENDKPIVKLSLSKGNGVLTLSNEAGENRIVLEGSQVPGVTLINDKNHIAASLGTFADSGFGYLQLLDENHLPRIQLQGGPVPGIYLRNQQAKTVGSFTILSDGGGGFGLANSAGNAAAILRGGANPSVSFFTSQNEPMAAIGVMQQVPHLLISGPQGNEGVLIHGGTPSSLLVVDEAGKVKILISKHGVFQGKEDEKENKKENRVFSFEDKNLFPEDESSKR